MNVFYKSLYENIRGLVVHHHVEHILKKNPEINHETGGNSTLTKEEEQYSFPLYPQYTCFFSTWDPHVRLLFTAVDTWKKNKIFGNGIKSFRIDCYKLIGSAIYPEAGYNLSPNVKLFKINGFNIINGLHFIIENIDEIG